jgi:protease I
MADELRGRKVAILATDGVEQVELEQPREAVERAGAETELLSLRTGEIQATHHDIHPTDTFPVDRPVSQASVDEFERPSRASARTSATPEASSSTRKWSPTRVW